MRNFSFPKIIIWVQWYWFCTFEITWKILRPLVEMQSKYRKIGGLLMWVLKGCLVLFCQKEKKRKKGEKGCCKICNFCFLFFGSCQWYGTLIVKIIEFPLISNKFSIWYLPWYYVTFQASAKSIRERYSSLNLLINASGILSIPDVLQPGTACVIVWSMISRLVVAFDICN